MNQEIKKLNPKEYVMELYGDKNKEAALSLMTYVKAQVPNLTDEEFKQFVLICHINNLNPVNREVYCVKYGNQFNIIVGYQEYVKRADATGLIDYYNVEIVDKNEKPYKAIFRGKRKDWSEELKMEFWFNEWNTGKSQWASKPFFMFEKVALANGLRRLVPNTLANMPYIQEEYWQDANFNDLNKKQQAALAKLDLDEDKAKKVLSTKKVLKEIQNEEQEQE